MPKPIDPVPNNAECERIMTSSPVGVLVMCEGSEPYAIPMNHAYADGKLYFHCAPTGRKLDMVRANPRVCYVVTYDFGERGGPIDPRQCHGDWESVIAYGAARVVEDRDELRTAFTIFVASFDSEFEVSEHALDTTSAIIVDVESMTSRREVPGQDVEYCSWSPDGC
jgi:nitroimidazol reductase NimA-like FMN-containing flavoprotein (pyridoxamine 5'-phosphate oxidase superfamily)